MRPIYLSAMLVLSSIISSDTLATTITNTCSIAGDTVVCENEVSTYTSGYSGAYTYLWNAFGGVISGTTTSPTVTVNWGYAGFGQLSVLIKDSLDAVICTKLINVTIYEAPTPEIIGDASAHCRGKDQGGPGGDASGVECESVCDSTWVHYYTAFHAGSSYSWIVDGADSVFVSGNEVDVYWAGLGVGTVTVIETNSYGCSATHEICIEIIEKPTAQFSTLPNPVYGIITVCLGQDVLFFNASYAGSGSPIESYEWIFGDGFTDFITPPDSGHTSHAYATSGTYTAYLVVTNECGCKDTASIEIEVLDTPGPEIYCVSTVCPGSVMSYSTDASCPSYMWSATNGTILSTDTLDEVTVQWGSSGPAILTLDIDPCTGFCPTPTSILVPLIPSTASIAGDTMICQGSCNTYKLSCDIPVDSIIWHVPAGLTVFGDTINVHELQICGFTAPFDGTLWVEYFHATNGSTQGLDCGGDAYFPIKVRPSMNLFGAGEYCENEAFSFSMVGSTGNFAWSVTSPDGSTTYSSSILPYTSPFTGVWLWGPGTFVLNAQDLDDDYCDEKISKVIKVNPSPPQPTLSGPDSICPNGTYNYSGLLSSSSNAMNWNVTGGSPSTGTANSINVTWDPTGPYALYATEIDPITGCKSVADTLVVNSYLPLAPAVIVGPDTMCANGSASFSTSGPADIYYWTINPSSSASVSNGQFTNAIDVQANDVTGTAWVVLERSLCDQSRRDSILVTIIPPPVPAITAPATVCQQENFSASSTTSASSYSWDFGDGSTASGSTANHDYDSAGIFTITLTVNYGGSCPTSVSITQDITVNPAPITNISTGDPTLYCSPGTGISTSMTLSTSTSTTSCDWYKSPSTYLTSTSGYTATTMGSYFVVCSNSYGCTDTSNIISIDTIPCDTSCTPENYMLRIDKFRLGCNTDSFTYTSSNVTGHSWTFGDVYNPGSNTASGNNVTHTYTEPGVYRITLCGYVPNSMSGGPDCQVCTSVNDTIHYIPDFFAQVNCTDYSDSYTVTFVNTTKSYALAPAPSYSWSINGSGTLSTGTDFTTSLSPGSYNVSLTIDGVCSLVQGITIDSLGQANFSVADSICEDARVFFTNLSTGSILSYDWQYGDGTSSLNPSPIKVYDNPGTYTSILTIVNAYGCLDSMHQNVLVLPNTLNGLITLSGPNEFCVGDSVQLSANPSGGYPAYSYLWNTTSTNSSITAYYTGNYGLQIWDAKGCYTQVPDTVVKVNPIPNTSILGALQACQYDQVSFKVALPTAGHSIQWYVNGTASGTSNQLFYYAASTGTVEIVVNATNSFGCSSSDTLTLSVHPRPNVAVSSFGSMCEGDSNLLVMSSSSTNLVSLTWNNGSSEDSIYGLNPGVYLATALDSNGCSSQAAAIVNPLPDLCGLMTGCYEICDTVTNLVWYAPTGYSSYQWYYNGTPISGSTADTLHIPLYQSGVYTVKVSNSYGCSVTSEPIDISFVTCGGCSMDAHGDILCGPVDPHGLQTYSLTFYVNSSLPDGSNVSISSSQGWVTGLSSSTVNNGANTLTATFTDVPPSDTLVCFTVAIWNEEQRCDTTFCVRLPACDCDESEAYVVSQTPFECIGHDGSGNPQYYGCVTVVWSGSGSSTLTLVEGSSAFSPAVFDLNTGSQTICFTYTDYAPANPLSVWVDAFFYDSTSMQTCQDSFMIHYKPCPDPCGLDITGFCVHCEEQDQAGTWTYRFEMDIYNPFGNNANVSIVPIAAGTFSGISPSTIPPGVSTVSVLFTDNPPVDTTICFRVVLTNALTAAICYKDLCIDLPDCDHVGISTYLIDEMRIAVYPNPVADLLFVDVQGLSNLKGWTVEVNDAQGQLLERIALSAQQTAIDLSEYASGLYLIQVKKNKDLIGSKKIVLQKE